jgi:hypothetical protein
VRILDLDQLKILFPVGTFFLKRSRAVTNLDPPYTLIRKKAGVAHIAEIFAFGHRALAQGPTLNGVQ